MKDYNFTEKAKRVHGNIYDYSLVSYKNSHAKVCIICPEHGEFWQRPDNHLRGQGCPSCKGGVSIDTNTFVKKANKVHYNRYDYSNVDYTNNRSKVKIICFKHGLFYQTPNSHLNGNGCPKCGNEIISKKLSRDIINRKIENIVQPEDYKIIITSKGNHVKVDNDDFERLMCFSWNLSTSGYATNNKIGAMHRFITNPQSGMFVDHINRDKLDNRKSNLRICTYQQNCFNVPGRKSLSGFKGVYFCKKNSKWFASISKDGKSKFLGYFSEKIDAAVAYDAMAKNLFGEFAYLNFPDNKVELLFGKEDSSND